MKNLVLLFCTLYLLTSCAQKDDITIKETKAFQFEQNLQFSNKEESPLTDKDFKTFSSLAFFDINKEFRVLADFKRTPNETPFEMLTTTSRLAKYVKYGEAHFLINEKPFVLSIYKNASAKIKPEYKNHLFLPFTDLTNNEESYAGGRFIDLSLDDITKDNKIVINFNEAYNPYCAYNHKYSCPIPPKENHLDTKINAGVKKYH